MPAITAACDDLEIARWIHQLPSPYHESDAREYVVSKAGFTREGTLRASGFNSRANRRVDYAVFSLLPADVR